MTTYFGVEWIKQAAVTPWMWAALISEAAAFVVWMRILSDHALSKAFPLSAISYLLILCIGWFFFHEAVLPLQLVGSALILAGVWLIGTANTRKETCNEKIRSHRVSAYDGLHECAETGCRQQRPL
jgi:drug/metabolite transporter (DMT)-like permease